MNLHALAHSVLFPVLTEVTPSDEILKFLDQGGLALLFGEYGEEYKSGELNFSRAARESVDHWAQTLSKLRDRSGYLLAAADADISAVNRFSHIALGLPSSLTANKMDKEKFEDAIYNFGAALPELGVNMVLSPTADVVSGRNPWLT